jgi:uncharacterized protein YukE
MRILAAPFFLLFATALMVLAARRVWLVFFLLAFCSPSGVWAGQEPTVGTGAAALCAAALPLTGPSRAGDDYADDESARSRELATAKAGEPTAQQLGLWVLCLAGVLHVVKLVKDILGKGELKPDPLRIVQGQRYADHDTTREALGEIKTDIKELGEKWEKWSSDQYKSRAGMHRRLNAMSNVLAYLAGQLAASGDERAQELREMLRKMDDPNTAT